MIRFAIAALTAATITVAAPARAETLETFTVGQWEGAAFANEESGTFTHCAVLADHDNGFTTGFSMGANGNWALDLIREDWDLEAGEAEELAVRIDQGQARELQGQTAAPKHMRALMPKDDALIEALRKGRTLFVTRGTETHAFSLAGSSKALAALEECVARHGVRITPRRVEATRGLIARVLQALDGKEAQLLDPETLGGPFARHEAVWRWGDIMGILDIATTQDAPTVQAVAEALVAADGSNCAGDFDAGVLPGVEDEGPPAARLFTTCRQDDAAFYLVYQIIPVQDGTYLAIAHWSTADISGEAARQADREFRAGLVRVLNGASE